MKENKALKKLKEGKITFGTAVNLNCLEIVKIAAGIGFDWIWIDWQHGLWTEESLVDGLSIMMDTDTIPIVRVRGVQATEINRVLDLGAKGVIVPMVNTREDAELVVRSARYTPQGRRSAGGPRLPQMGDNMDSMDYITHANDQIMVIAQIETVEAMQNLQDIVSVPGIDVLMIGPMDLLLDVQANGGDEAERDRLVDNLLAVCKKTGIAAGYVCPSTESAKPYFEKGFQFLPVGVDFRILLGGFEEILDTLRSW
jgi:2-keto-3-deoxy-L-rhamnonate aldolase RhmA